MVSEITFANLNSFFIFLPILITFFFLSFKRFLFINRFAKQMNISWNFLSFSSLQKIKACILATGLIFLAITFLRIQWGELDKKFSQEGRTILFALDISRSMLAQDVSPSRLELAKAKIHNLLEILGPERVGLMAFASQATLLCPFTNDFKNQHSPLKNSLEQIDQFSVSSGKTLLETPIEQAIKVFNRIKSLNNKILIIFTDGEDFSGDKLKYSLQQAKQSGIKVITAGIGTEQGAPVPIVDARGRFVGHEKDDDGNIILTKLNSEKLQNVAQQASGRFVQSGYMDTDLEKISDFINQFEKEKFEDINTSEKKEWYHWFAGISALSFLTYFIL